MQNLPNTIPTPLTVDTTGSEFEPESFDIAPEDHELAESFMRFDPVDDIPSPIEAEGEFRIPARFSANMLPDAPRKWVMDQLGAVPAGEARDQREHDLTLKALRENSKDVRVRLGAGPGATEYQRELLNLDREQRELENEVNRIQNSLTEAVRLDVIGTDPNTGEQLTKTVYRHEGDTRRQLEFRLAEVVRQLVALEGAEGQRRERKALFNTVKTHKDQQARLSMMKEAMAKAVEINRQLEVDHMAQAFTKNRRNTLG